MKSIYPLLLEPGTVEGKGTAVSTRATLRIEARPISYKLALLSGDVEEEFSFLTKDLTVPPPVGSVFCGVLFGIYASGKGEPVLNPADFSNIYIKDGRFQVSEDA
jgi:hypothetical protein